MAVAIVELNGEHVGNDIIRELEHVVVGDGADGVVVEHRAVLVADDDGDVLQFVRHGKHKRVALVTQYGQERWSVMDNRTFNIVVISQLKLYTRGNSINKIPPPNSDWQEL